MPIVFVPKETITLGCILQTADNSLSENKRKIDKVPQRRVCLETTVKRGKPLKQETQIW